MDLPIRLLTWFLVLLLIFLMGLAVRVGGPATIAAVVVAIVFVAIIIGLRPLRFEVDGAGLRIRWPLCSFMFGRRSLIQAERIDRRAFAAEFGGSIRVGAGGFLGTFGYLWTRRKGWVVVQASRMSDLVLVRTRSGPLLLTPERPDEFVDRLNQLVTDV